MDPCQESPRPLHSRETKPVLHKGRTGDLTRRGAQKVTLPLPD